MDAVEQTCRQRADDAAQPFGGAVKAHDQIFLCRIGFLRRHMLHQRQADGIAGINHDAAGDIDGHTGNQQHAKGGNGAEQGDGNHGFLDIGLADDPHAKGHVGHKGNKANRGLDDAVIRGSQTQLIFQIVVESMVEAEVAEIRQDIDGKEQREGFGHKVFSVEDGLQGIGTLHNFPCRQFDCGGEVRFAGNVEQNAGDDHGNGKDIKRAQNGEFTQHTAGQIAERRGNSLNGGTVGQEFCLIFGFCLVDHISQKSHKAAAGEEAGQGTHQQDGTLQRGVGKTQLRQCITDTGDKKGVAGGNHGGDFSPEGRKQEHEQQRGRRHQAKHIVRQIQILNQRGRHRMNEIAGENVQDHCEKEQRKAKLVTHIDVLTFCRAFRGKAEWIVDLQSCIH